MWIKLPDGEPTTNLQSLLPNTINPQNLPVAEREAQGVFECVITQPVIAWYQQRGERVIDTEARPVTVTWAVGDRPIADVRQRAVQQLRSQVDQTLFEPMAYEFPTMAATIRVDEILRERYMEAQIAPTADPMPVVDAGDRIHWMTPAQIIAMFEALMARRRLAQLGALTVATLEIPQRNTVVSIVDATVLPDPWVQPTGAHDVYPSGVIVTHQNRVWLSMIANNANAPESGTWLNLTVDPGQQYPTWAQPIGGWGYLLGFRVHHNGVDYESTHNGANSWTPGTVNETIWAVI